MGKWPFLFCWQSSGPNITFIELTVQVRQTLHCLNITCIGRDEKVKKKKNCSDREGAVS